MWSTERAALSISCYVIAFLRIVLTYMFAVLIIRICCGTLAILEFKMVETSTCIYYDYFSSQAKGRHLFMNIEFGVDSASSVFSQSVRQCIQIYVHTIACEILNYAHRVSMAKQ